MTKFQPHIATFEGNHNRTKSLVLILLYQRYQAGLPGLSAAEISDSLGLPLHSLRTLLPKWDRWHHYVIRKPIQTGGRLCWRYSIGERGAKFVSLRIPPDKYNEYVQEINDYIRGKR